MVVSHGGVAHRFPSLLTSRDITRWVFVGRWVVPLSAISSHHQHPVTASRIIDSRGI